MKANNIFALGIGIWSIVFIIWMIWIGMEPNVYIRWAETLIGCYALFFLVKLIFTELKGGNK